MIVSYHLPDRDIDKEGIRPDVRLDIPYPTELTDNVDEWVLWIAQDLKKRQAAPALSTDYPSNVNY